MENRKHVKFLIPIFVLGLFITNSGIVFAYEIETHAYLTGEVVKFYNQNFSNQQISNELKDYLIDGSRREDDIPRWMNHFYDPVYNRGLTDSTLGTWQKSKDWAQDSTNQNSLTYKVSATIASVLTAIQQKKLSLISDETDFTWQRAVRLYVQGDTEKAMFMLGHILHLIEDASVPDHTRNDPHPGDSPYENWTERFTLANPDRTLEQRLNNKKPLASFSSLNSYFDELAKYSNNNFYSKDRIGKESGYDSPNLDIEGLLKKDGDYYYAMNYDEDNNLYHLSVYKNYRNSLILETKFNIVLKLEDEDKVVNDYWSHLSTKSVQYGAGVINLFFQEVEKAKNDPNFAKQEKKSFFGQVIDTTKNLANQVGNFFSANFGSNQDFQSTGEVSLQTEESEKGKGESQIETVQSIGQTKIDNSQKTQSQTQQVQTQKSDSSSKLQQQIIEEDEEVQPLQKKQAQSSQKQATTTQQQTQTQTTPTFKECSFATTQSPSRQKIIINEVAWMGTSASANDEWIELKNILGSEIDLSGWQLLDAKEDVKVVFGEEDKRGIINKKISTNGFYLLERTDDDSVPGIIADFVYSGALSNSDEGLRLFDGQCNLIDEVLANPGWPAGNNTSAAERKTMERNSGDFNWHTSSVIGGTPKQNNSTPAVVYSGGGGGGVSATTQQQITDNTQQISAEIRITEIMYDLVGSDSGREWLEIFNAGSSAVNLEGWKFYEDNTNHSLNLIQGSANLGAGGYAIIADDSAKFLQDYPQYTGALFDSSFSLSNAGESIAIKNGDTVVNEANYNSSQGANGDGKSLQLINNQWLPAAPTPGAANQTSQSEAPGASFVNYLVISEIYPDKTGGNFDFIELYNPTDSSVGLEDYSLKILKEGTTSTDSLASFSASYTIAARSFFLAGLDDYGQSTSTPADISRSSSFLPTTQAATIILYDGNNSVDEFNYNPTILASGQSIERKAFSNNVCLSSQNDGEFLGNGCDTDGVDYFEIRSAPNPQNSASLPEPRTSPAAPSGFTIQYSSSMMELVFNWSASQDYSGATSNITYKITNISNSSSTTTTSTTLTTTISETGRSYQFSIQAFDKDGLGSATSSAQIDVPAPQNNSPTVLMSQLDDSAFSTLTITSISNYSIVNYGYQEFGSGLSGRLHSLVLKVASGNGANRFELREYGDSSYSQLERYWPNYDPVSGFNLTDFIIKRADGSVWEFRQVANFDDFENITIEFANIEANPSKYYRLFFDSGDASRRIFFKGSNGDVGFGRFNFCWATGGPWSGIPTQCRDIDFDIYFILKILP